MNIWIVRNANLRENFKDFSSFEQVDQFNVNLFWCFFLYNKTNEMVSNERNLFGCATFLCIAIKVIVKFQRITKCSFHHQIKHVVHTHNKFTCKYLSICWFVYGVMENCTENCYNLFGFWLPWDKNVKNTLKMNVDQNLPISISPSLPTISGCLCENDVDVDRTFITALASTKFELEMFVCLVRDVEFNEIANISLADIRMTNTMKLTTIDTK